MLYPVHISRCRGRERGAGRCGAAAGRFRREGEEEANGGPAVGGSHARSRSLPQQEERTEAGGGNTAPPQRLRRTHTLLVYHSERTAHR